MARLTKDDVKHVESLAKLKLTPKERGKYRKQLSEVISYVDKLAKVDTSKVEPTSQTTGLENVTREDKVEIENCLDKEDALSGTEKVKNDYFVVPAVLAERTDG